MRHAIILSILTLGVLVSYQHCSRVSFSSAPGGVTRLCVITSQDDPNCDEQHSFHGKIYYFLNKDAPNATNTVYDNMDNPISFPSGVNNVQMFFDRALVADVDLVLSQVFVPEISFSQGFKDTQNNYVKDQQGNILIEAFAFRIEGKLHITDAMDEGDYEFATLSDDGSKMYADVAGTGNYQTIVDNDGTHSTRMGCSSNVINFKHGVDVPVRLDYYQGPRTEIAMTFLMRKVPAGTSGAGHDQYCGTTSRTLWFNGDPTSNGYTPNLTNSYFGDLTQRGWIVPDATMVNQ